MKRMGLPMRPPRRQGGDYRLRGNDRALSCHSRESGNPEPHDAGFVTTRRPAPSAHVEALNNKQADRRGLATESVGQAAPGFPLSRE